MRRKTLWLALTGATVAAVAVLLGASSNSAQPTRVYQSRYDGSLVSTAIPSPNARPISAIQAWRVSEQTAQTEWVPSARVVEVYTQDAGDSTPATRDRGSDGRRLVWQAIAVSQYSLEHQLSIWLVGSTPVKVVEQPRVTALIPPPTSLAFDSISAVQSARAARPNFVPSGGGQLTGFGFVVRVNDTGRFTISVIGMLNLNPGLIDFDAKDGSFVSAQTLFEASGVAVSNDSGATWRQADLKGFLAGTARMNGGAVALVEEQDGLALMSSVDGASWRVWRRLGHTLGMRALAVAAGTERGGDLIGIGTEKGLWVSSDHGQSWSQAFGLPNGPVRWLGIGDDPNGSLVSASVTGGAAPGTYVTADLKQWHEIGSGSFRTTKSGDGRLVASPSSAGDITQVVDHGGATPIAAPPDTMELVDTGGRRLAGTTTGIWIQDGSGPWRQALTSQWQVDTVSASPSFAIDHTALAASIHGPIFRSVDSGQSWTQVAAVSNAFGLLFLSATTVIAAEEGANTWQDF